MTQERITVRHYSISVSASCYERLRKIAIDRGEPVARIVTEWVSEITKKGRSKPCRGGLTESLI